MAKEPVSPDSEDDEEVGWRIQAPSPWTPLLRFFRLPVVARGGKDIYRVFLLGEGFQIKFEPGKPLVGFYTIRYVTAETIREAGQKAKNAVFKEWKRKGWAWITKSDPVISIEEIEILPEKFLWQRGGEFSFFPAGEDGK